MAHFNDLDERQVVATVQERLAGVDINTLEWLPTDGNPKSPEGCEHWNARTSGWAGSQLKWGKWLSKAANKMWDQRTTREQLLLLMLDTTKTTLARRLRTHTWKGNTRQVTMVEVRMNDPAFGEAVFGVEVVE